MKKMNILASTFVMASLLAFTACGNDEETKAATGATGAGYSETLKGNLTESKTIAANSTVLLTGAVRVKSGVTLTIGAGTTIKADTSTLSYLLVERGGKLIAEGTATTPIVFTSAANERSASDWGGIVIHGYSATNSLTGKGTGLSEIGTGTFGCGDETTPSCTAAGVDTVANSTDDWTEKDTDNSGTLKYVRIEFAGSELAAGIEFNGLFMLGVGKNTIVDHVQVHRGSDDGIEIFGGSVNITHAVLDNNQDDQLDLDDGWRGYAQYVVVAKNDDSDKAIEYDGGSGDTTRSTDTVFTNFTILGKTGDKGLIDVKDKGGLRLINSYIAHSKQTDSTACSTAMFGFTNANSDTNSYTGRVAKNHVLDNNAFANLYYGTTPITDLAGDNYYSQDQGGVDKCGTSSGTSSVTVNYVTGVPGGTASTNINVAAVTTEPAANTLWGATNGISELKPNAAISGVTVNTAYPTAPNGDTITATYVSAFSGATDAWADGWTSFPTK